jgi:hypothetical protein
MNYRSQLHPRPRGAAGDTHTVGAKLLLDWPIISLYFLGWPIISLYYRYLTSTLPAVGVKDSTRAFAPLRRRRTLRSKGTFRTQFFSLDRL